MVKLFQPFVSEEAILNMVRVARSGQIAEGPEVKLFEEELCKKLNLERVLAVNSGTSALELAYDLAGIGPGDEVITPVLTCTATNIPLVRRGAKIIFADIDYDLNVNIQDVKNKITESTKAVVFVHFAGNSRGLRELVEICNSKGIVLIEDAAQAIGNNDFGRGDFTCLSLQAVKTITTGDGGLLICKKEEDHKKAKNLRWFGYDREEKQKHGDVDLLLAGYKYHMNDIQAGMGRGNLSYFDIIMNHQKKLADIYKSYGLFAHSWLAGGICNNYKELRHIFYEKGIEIGQHHYRNDKYTVFAQQHYDDARLYAGFPNRFPGLPIMDELEHKYFFVPFHLHVSEEDAHKIGKLYQEYALK